MSGHETKCSALRSEPTMEFGKSTNKKWWFPGFVLLFQVVFLILYGTFVEYHESGSPLLTINIHDHNGSLQEGSTATQVYPFFQDVHLMIFVGFGFLMAFLRRYGCGSVSFNLLLGAFAIQWYTLTSGFLTQFIHQVQAGLGTNGLTITVSLKSLVSSDFAAAAVLITMGAVLGRASPFQLVIIAFLELMFYSANEAFNIHVLKAADIGGSLIIHTFGAYFGLACSFMLHRKKAVDHDFNSSVYHSDLFSMIGTLFLWLFWPSFNGALAVGNAQTRAVVNTFYSMTGSVMAAFIFSMFFDANRKLSMTHIQNATLAGGVAVGAVADMVLRPWGAIAIGFSGGFISTAGYSFLSKSIERWFHLQDTCGVHNLHGLPGVFAGIVSFLAAGFAETMKMKDKVSYGNSLYLVFPARAPRSIEDLTPEQLALGIQPGEGHHAGLQAGFQLALLACTLFIAIFSGLLTGLIVRLPFFQRTDDDDLFDDYPYWKLPDDAEKFLPDGAEADTHFAFTNKQASVVETLPSATAICQSHDFVLKNEQTAAEEEGSDGESMEEEDPGNMNTKKEVEVEIH